MSKLVQGVVDKTSVKGPYDGKFGKYYIHNISVGGLPLTKFDKSLELVGQGAEIMAIYEETNTERGTSNKITKLEVIKGGLDSTPTQTGTTSNVVSLPAPKQHSSNQKSYDPAGQIKGNSVSNGVQLAIARKGEHVTKEDILAAAREILEIHAELDNKG